MSVLSKRRRLHGVIGLLSVCLAGAASAAQPHGIPGYLDPSTGKFSAQTVAPDAAAAMATVSLTFNVTLNITVASTIPANQPILCDTTVNGTDAVTFATYTVQAQAIASRSGTSATCTVTLPALWTVSAGSTYAPSYVVTTQGSNGLLRSASFFTPAGTKIPASGSKPAIVLDLAL